MNKRRKHADIIHAWAEGEEIEWRELGFDRWFPVRTGASPAWSADYEYRIKPKIVKREGWVALFNNGRDFPSCCGIYETEELCREVNGSTVKVVRIEWEEEV